jgi:hypothetical protein
MPRTNSANRPVTFAAFSVLAICCGGARALPLKPSEGREDAGLAPRPPPSARAPAASEPRLDEAAARALLAEEFRRAGFRILRDQKIAAGTGEVTLDGYDPERHVGYEYIAAEERGVDLNNEERRVLAVSGESVVLVLDACGVKELHERTQSFLREHPLVPAKPPQ